ncbi:hypothetical protein K523DRAFT_325938 [Schizophyllum commune Tattone D]|nr:hypothetical protein K523DRAFT_325938 [Schizophyllum commune Tattone D]
MGLLRPKRAACTAPQPNLPPHTYKRRIWGTCLPRTRAGFHYAGARLRLGAGPACIQTEKISTCPAIHETSSACLMVTPTVLPVYSPPEDARPSHRRWLTPCARACSTFSTARTLSPNRAFIPFRCLLRRHALDTYALGITAALADVLLRRLMLASTSSRMEIHSRTTATAVEGAVQRVAATRSAMVRTEQCVFCWNNGVVRTRRAWGVSADRRRDAYPLNGSATATLSNPCAAGQRAVVGIVPRASGRGLSNFVATRPSNATQGAICPPKLCTRQVTIYTRSFDVGVVPSRSSMGPLLAYLASTPLDRRNDLQKGTGSLGPTRQALGVAHGSHEFPRAIFTTSRANRILF